MNNIFKIVEDFFNLSNSIYSLIKNSNYLMAQREIFPFVRGNELFNLLNNSNEIQPLKPYIRNFDIFQNEIEKINLNKNIFEYADLFFPKNSEAETLNSNFYKSIIGENEYKDIFSIPGNSTLSDTNSSIFNKNSFENRDNSVFLEQKYKKHKNTELLHSKYKNFDTDEIENIEIEDELIDKIGELLACEIKNTALNRSVL